MAKKPAEWCLMESDPGVFTELLKNFGVEGLQIDEPWELSYQWFEQTKYVYGIILLFKMDSNELVHGEYDKVRKDIYFSKQIAPNSCATIALLNIVMNIDCEEIEKGKIVNNIMDFTKEFTSHDRGATIAEADDIKKIHNSFSSDIFLHIDVDKEDYEDGDDFHFVGFIPIGGYLYELDGLKPYPINHGKIPDGEIWTNKATDVLKKRMESFPKHEIRFNVMAVISDQIKMSTDQIEKLSRLNEPEDKIQIELLKERLASEKRIRNTQIRENIRRRHNYVPLIMHLIKEFSMDGSIEKHIQSEEEKRKKRIRKL